MSFWTPPFELLRNFERNVLGCIEANFYRQGLSCQALDYNTCKRLRRSNLKHSENFVQKCCHPPSGNVALCSSRIHDHKDQVVV